MRAVDGFSDAVAAMRGTQLNLHPRCWPAIKFGEPLPGGRSPDPNQAARSMWSGAQRLSPRSEISESVRLLGRLAWRSADCGSAGEAFRVECVLGNTSLVEV